MNCYSKSVRSAAQGKYKCCFMVTHERASNSQVPWDDLPEVATYLKAEVVTKFSNFITCLYYFGKVSGNWKIIVIILMMRSAGIINFMELSHGSY